MPHLDWSGHETTSGCGIGYLDQYCNKVKRAREPRDEAIIAACNLLFPFSYLVLKVCTSIQCSVCILLLPAILQGGDEIALEAETADAHTSIVSNITIRLGHKKNRTRRNSSVG